MLFLFLFFACTLTSAIQCREDTGLYDFQRTCNGMAGHLLVWCTVPLCIGSAGDRVPKPLLANIERFQRAIPPYYDSVEFQEKMYWINGTAGDGPEPRRFVDDDV